MTKLMLIKRRLKSNIPVILYEIVLPAYFSMIDGAFHVPFRTSLVGW